MNLPLVLLGVPFASLAGVVVFRSIWAIFVHSNVSLRLGAFGFVVGSPAHHQAHHVCDREAGNYANLPPCPTEKWRSSHSRG